MAQLQAAVQDALLEGPGGQQAEHEEAECPFNGGKIHL